MSHLAEATWVHGAVYERDARQIALAVEMLLNHRTLVLQHAEAVQAALSRHSDVSRGGAPALTADSRIPSPESRVQGPESRS